MTNQPQDLPNFFETARLRFVSSAPELREQTQQVRTAKDEEEMVEVIRSFARKSMRLCKTARERELRLRAQSSLEEYKISY